MISQIYYTVGYTVKISNPYQKNNIVFDSTYIIFEYDIILLNMKYFIRYIIAFRLVNRITTIIKVIIIIITYNNNNNSIL